jgi:D-3-phosphoglycerate dehydrogenase
MGLLNSAAFSKMKAGVRIINCARGELINIAALREAIGAGRVGGAALDVLQTEPPEAGEPLLALENVFATPHIGGSTEEAQELAGIRLAEHLIEYLTEGIAVNAVNVPAISEEAHRAVAPFVDLAERLGTFAAHISVGNPRLVRLVYHGNLAPQNTHWIRNAGLAGVLSRSVEQRPNVVNALKIAADRGLSYAERFERPTLHADTIRIELETDQGTTLVEGAIVLDRPRLLSVNGIRVEAPLAGHLAYFTHADAPGVLGYVGNITGRNKINIAALSLGRQDKPARPGEPLMGVTVLATDQLITDAMLKEALENKAIKMARCVEFRS